MGTVVVRTREDGTSVFQAQICLKASGQTYRECQTHRTRKEALGWPEKREAERDAPALAEEMLPAPLEKGSLDVSEVLESDYFFA